MKITLYILGIFIFLFASFKLIQYGFSGKGFTAYGNGYVWGNIVLVLAGLILIFLAWKRERSR